MTSTSPQQRVTAVALGSVHVSVTPIALEPNVVVIPPGHAVLLHTWLPS
jgi:hypothetical protein